MDALAALPPGGGMIAASCAALGLSRASLHRRKRPARAARPRAKSGRALDANERRAVLDLLREPRFVDLAPAEIYACLLDEGLYLCSIRTMYRVLREHDEVRERRRQLRHPIYKKPELLAEAPNQVWSWDITKLMGPVKWSYFYLYVIMDIFSRRIVGWHVADAETAALFKPLFDDAVLKHDIAPGQLTLHADEGQGHRAPARRSRRHKITQQALHLERQSVLGKLLQNPEISTAVSKALRLHRGRETLLSRLFRLVQSRSSSRRHRIDDAGPGSLRSGRRGPRSPPKNPRPCLRHEPRTLRQKIAQSAKQANSRLDQSAHAQNAKQGTNQSLNSNSGCLIVVDTFRARFG